MRVTPIDNPRQLIAKIFYWAVNLGFAGGVVEQQPEPGRVGGRGREESADALLGELVGAGGGDEPAARVVEDRLVKVGLGVEVAVEDGAADAGLGGDVVEVGGGETGSGEGTGSGGDDLLASLAAG